MTKRRWRGKKAGGKKDTYSFLLIMRNVPFAVQAGYLGEEYSGW